MYHLAHPLQQRRGMHSLHFMVVSFSEQQIGSCES